MARSSRLAESLDHPIFFSLVIALTTCGWLAVLTWLSKAAGLPGPAALFQHP